VDTFSLKEHARLAFAIVNRSMDILFVHQNFPGQFKYLATHLAASPDNRVMFLTQRGDRRIPGITNIVCKPHRQVAAQTHRYLRQLESGVLYGQAAAKAAIKLRQEGFRPDIIVAHPGWGEALYLKDVFPSSPLLNYCEWFYRPDAVCFDAEFQQPANEDSLARLRTRNALHLLNLDAADQTFTPTRWQWQQHPEVYRHQMAIIHEGVDTEQLHPNPEAHLEFASGTRLTPKDEVITYISRNLEPYRGFHQFMRAAALIAERRPNAHFIVVGENGVSYGDALPHGETYRQRMLAELPQLDLNRFHFLGRVPYAHFKTILQLSSVHIYLTYPFVLSWSMLEAMACGCLVLGSDTPPVREVISDGENGLLVDFFSPQAIAERVDQVLAAPDRLAELRQAARRCIQQHYDLRTHCLPRQLQLIERVSARGC
jgi:glycosyltransferase involved in cell wall biosynthesis